MDHDAARRLDEDDPLRALRARFDLPEGVVYLDGNSLGPLPRDVPARLDDVVAHEWGTQLVGAWNSAGWIGLPQRVAGRIARLVGADPAEVKVGDSTTVNLSLVLDALLPASEGSVVLVERDAFPTDRYVAAACAARHGKRLIEREKADVLGRLSADVALVLLTHVDYRTAEVWDAAAVTTTAHAAGARVVWDLSHSTGAVEVDLGAWDAEGAVGCTYKYLNGGPGAPGYLFLRGDLLDDVTPAIPGWMGHASPFEFDAAYRPARGADRFLVGTPPILSLAAVDEALAIWDDVDPALVAAKGRLLTQVFVDGVEATCPDLAVLSPRVPGIRGCHVLLGHPEGYAIVQASIGRGVVGDFRPPDGLRFGFAPLYTRFVDVVEAVGVLADVMDTRAWDEPRYRRRKPVT